MSMVPTDAPFIGWDWDIVSDADMNDALPPLYYNGAAINLTGCTVEVYIRPSYGYDVPIAVLTSSGGHITIDNAALGLVTVFRAQATVETWPIGHWQFFVVVTDGAGKRAEVARGPFNIHAGDDSLT